MRDAERYAITVRKVLVDGEELWRATVRELPDLAEFAETRDEAIELLLEAVDGLKESAAEEGRTFPEPLEDEDGYSGRVTLRMSKSMHRAAALRAIDEDVSLNSYIVECIALRSHAGVTVYPMQAIPGVSVDYNKLFNYNKLFDYKCLEQAVSSNVMVLSVAAGGIATKQFAISTATHWDAVPTVPEYLLEKRRSA